MGAIVKPLEGGLYSVLEAVVSRSKSLLTCCSEKFKRASHVLLSLSAVNDQTLCLSLLFWRCWEGEWASFAAGCLLTTDGRLQQLLLPCLAWTVSMVTHPQVIAICTAMEETGVARAMDNDETLLFFPPVSPTQQMKM